ncbi:dihydropyrimidinase [Patulibacter defluvii]|uniref:dihydropyrimidinase n=1 Tax=Patulibacter defluvii TaxID=3095358 RepID=UPI002A7655B9|nr:dihydropyrimidinase [Patulibacter sp. DM4]
MTGAPPTGSLLIRGGRVVNSDDERDADVLVEDGTITAIGTAIGTRADRVVDASGLYVLPGAIDPHTHIDLDYAGSRTVDDFTVATAGAAVGGTTCVIDFAMQEPGASCGAALATWHGKLERTPPLVDVGFHIALSEFDGDRTPAELVEVAGQGVTSFKLFMAYKDDVMVDDQALFRTLQIAREQRCLTMVHAENGDAIDVLVRQALAAGHRETIWHARTRPPLTESEATARAIALARVAEAPLYVVHVSCREALDAIVAARRAGAAVWGETCPQYLTIDSTWLKREDGAKYVFAPPPRTPADQEALLRGLAQRDLQAFGSDHCPYQYETEKALAPDFATIPSGGPTIEHRLQVLWHLGVNGGRLSPSDVVDLAATTPARLFGLPRKGAVAVGGDADLVLWDGSRELELSATTHRSRADHSMFEGMTVRGAAHSVFVRGRPVVEDFDVVGEPGLGRFVARERFTPPTTNRRSVAPTAPRRSDGH